MDAFSCGFSVLFTSMFRYTGVQQKRCYEATVSFGLFILRTNHFKSSNFQLQFNK